MIKYWERKQNALAYYWFTSDLALEEKVRREFYLVIDAMDSGSKNISDDGLELPDDQPTYTNKDPTTHDDEDEDSQKKGKEKNKKGGGVLKKVGGGGEGGGRT
jgi:hypothetical protein